VSEQDNVAQIVAIYEAFGRGDIPYIIDHLTDDVRWVSHLDANVPWSGDFSGKSKTPGFFQALNDAAEVTGFAPKEFVAQGDTVVSMGDIGLKVRKSGKAGTTQWIFVWKLRDGTVYSYEQFHDPALGELFR
jgi:uncharacterized protein